MAFKRSGVQFSLPPIVKFLFDKKIWICADVLQHPCVATCVANLEESMYPKPFKKPISKFYYRGMHLSPVTLYKACKILNAVIFYSFIIQLFKKIS